MPNRILRHKIILTRKQYWSLVRKVLDKDYTIVKDEGNQLIINIDFKQHYFLIKKRC